MSAPAATATTHARSFRLDDQVALITGGTAGIGLAIAESFLRAGASVVINGWRAAAADRVMAALEPAICPGLVMTDVVRDRAPAQAATMGITVEQLIGLLEQDAALQRLITPEEVATPALLVASPAGSGITGANLSVDGGNTPY